MQLRSSQFKHFHATNFKKLSDVLSNTNLTMHLTSSVALLGLLSAIPLALSIPTQSSQPLARREQMDGQSAGLIITTYNVPNCPVHANQNVSYDITYGKQVLANTWSYSLNRNL